jgi:hypothetical protein
MFDWFKSPGLKKDASPLPEAHCQFCDSQNLLRFKFQQYSVQYLLHICRDCGKTTVVDAPASKE